jgi:hypothetical protein
VIHSGKEEEGEGSVYAIPRWDPIGPLWSALRSSDASRLDREWR